MEHNRCLRCGRKLKNPEQKKLGYGPSCYLKVQQSLLKKKKLIGEILYDKTTGTTGAGQH